MDLDLRMTEVIKAVNGSIQAMSPREITTTFISDPTSSDIATAGHILKILHFLGLVGKKQISKTKVSKYKYFKLKTIKLPIKCPVVERYECSK